MAKLISLIALLGAVAYVYGQQCGTTPGIRPNRKFGGDGQRIVGGVEARPNSHPWIVSLQQGGSHFCGGSLLNVGSSTQTDIVLTAAHCVYDGVSSLTATAGAHDLRRPTSTQQTVRGSKYIYHPEYDPDTTENDVALIKLSTPIKFNSYAVPACLPASGDQVPDNAEGIVAGWGLTKEGGFDTSSILLQVGVPTINSATCQRQYRSAGVGIVPEAMICAGFSQGGKDSCQGDSGGPFVFKSGSSYVQHGVVSFGVGCARPGLPGVYTRLSNYISWIQSTAKSLSSVSG